MKGMTHFPDTALREVWAQAMCAIYPTDNKGIMSTGTLGNGGLE